MYFVYGLILIIASIFQFESNFKRGFALVVLAIMFFGLDILSDFLKRLTDVRKNVVVNLTSKDVDISKDLNKI